MKQEDWLNSLERRVCALADRIDSVERGTVHRGEGKHEADLQERLEILQDRVAHLGQLLCVDGSSTEDRDKRVADLQRRLELLQKNRDELWNELHEARKALSDYSINIINIPMADGIRGLTCRAEGMEKDLEMARERNIHLSRMLGELEKERERALDVLPLYLNDKNEPENLVERCRLLVHDFNEGLWRIEDLREAGKDRAARHISSSLAKVIYVAGPFRGKTAWEVECNVHAAERVGLAVANLGAFPMIPHANTRYFHGLLDDQFLIDGTLELMRRCDAVIMVEDFQRSEGALGEEKEARALGIPVFYQVADLDNWLNGEDPDCSTRPI